MYFNRAQAKQAARESMRRARPSYLLVMVLYVLLTTGVSYLLAAVMGSDLSEQFLLYIQQGYDPAEVFRYLLERNGQEKIALLSAVQFVQGLYTTLVGFGLTSYTLRLARNENPGSGHLLDGFLKAGRVLWMNILVGIFAAGWYLVIFVPLIAAAVMLSFSDFAMNALVALMMVGIFVMIAIVLRYVLADYFLLDDPNCTAREAIRRSKTAMRGHRWEYVVLGLSFLGWILLIWIATALATMVWLPLGTIVTAVATLWYTPYVMVTQANFYDCISASILGERTSGDYAGPNYDYHASDGPEPF